MKTFEILISKIEKIRMEGNRERVHHVSIPEPIKEDDIIRDFDIIGEVSRKNDFLSFLGVDMIVQYSGYVFLIKIETNTLKDERL